MNTHEKLIRMNALAKNLQSWKGKMPIEFLNIRNEIWAIGYDLFSEIDDEDKTFVTRTIYGSKNINRVSVFEALSMLFDVTEESDGTSHFYYQPSKGASFSTVLYQKAVGIFEKDHRKQIKTISYFTPIGNDGIEDIEIIDIIKGGNEPPIENPYEIFAQILNGIEKSFAGFKGKAKKYIAYRAIFTYNILKELRKEKNQNFQNSMDMIRENESFFWNNMDIDYNSFFKYRKLWLEEESKSARSTSRTDRPALKYGFIEYNIVPPIDSMFKIFSNAVVHDNEGYRMTDDRDKTLQKYLDEKGSLFDSCIKPYAKLFSGIKEDYNDFVEGMFYANNSDF